MDPLFTVRIECLNCENKYETSRVRPSFKKTFKKDSDFCGYYKEVNPDYYVVRVCPFCGFATTENSEDRLSDQQREIVRQKITSNWSMRDYSGERTWEEALQTYKLALICAQIKNEKPRVLAGILHHIAWLYRYKNDVENEKKFLEFTLDAYIQVYEAEQGETNSARLMYMLGEISRRLKKYNEAVKWFSRVINEKKIMDSAMIKACREQWAVTREDMLAAQLEFPEEMIE